MRVKQSWTIQSFFVCFLFNALLVGIFYYMASEILKVIHQWMDPFLGTNAAELPEDIESALNNLQEFFRQVKVYLAPVLFGIGGAMTLLLWLILQFEGRRMINRAQKEAAEIAIPPSRETLEKEKEIPVVEKETRYTQPSPGAAIQMLSLLQRHGRLIDFLQEDLSLYEDHQIGAAVRNIHEGCKVAINEHVDLDPVFKEEEGTEVDIPSGFDANAIRLTGNIVGDPPFHGVLRHRGWRVARIELPQSTLEKESWVVAPAEVELS